MFFLSPLVCPQERWQEVQEILQEKEEKKQEKEAADRRIGLGRLGQRRSRQEQEETEVQKQTQTEEETERRRRIGWRDWRKNDPKTKQVRNGQTKRVGTERT